VNDVESMFWPKVQKGPDCWEWTSVRGRGGYGRMSVNGTYRAAHRISWELVNGAIPAGRLLDHTCHNKGCVNPDHLRIVNHKQNAENMRSAPRHSPTGLRGVTYSKRRGCYEARVGHNGKRLFAGYHSTPEEAAEAAKQLRLSLFTHNDMDRKTA